MKIGLDIDGVLADFIGSFRKEASLVLQRQILGEPVDWEFSNWMTADEQTKVWEKVSSTINWFETLRPLPGVWENLPNLVSKHQVYFISTRSTTKGRPVEEQTQWWLHGIGVNFPNVFITKDKGPVAGALKLDVFLDDKPENLTDIENHSKNTRLFLQDASHNKSATIGTRVKNFEDFIAKYGQPS